MQPSYAIPTQTAQIPGAEPMHLILPLRVPQEREIALELVNIPKRANDLVRQIAGSDLFTTEQKSFAINWEQHFIQLLSRESPFLSAKAVCFLGMKVIVPALAQYADNRLASEQLLPFLQAQRELLVLLLPEKANVEGFIIQCEEIYDLMKETIMKLNNIITMNQETERLIVQNAETIRERILANANQSREMLRELARQWQSRINPINIRLTQLMARADDLKQNCQDHSHHLEAIGTQLADENRVFLGLLEDLKHLLRKV